MKPRLPCCGKHEEYVWAFYDWVFSHWSYIMQSHTKDMYIYIYVN